MLGGSQAWIELLWANRRFLVPLSFALLPSILLSLSVCNSPLQLRDRWTLGSTIMFLGTMAMGHGFGESDGEEFLNSGVWNRRGKYAPEFPDELETRWLSRILPIILTTAFVLLAVWRRAVRDAEVEVADGVE